MPLDQVQLAALHAILKACAEECVHSPIGNLLEGHLKVISAEALLRAGYSLMESANRRGSGRLLSLKDGRIHHSECPRETIAALPDTGKKIMSPDLRIWEPCRLVVELQVRSMFGSQSALFSDNILDDMTRVGRSAAGAFVLAADRPLYDALRGIKADNRGRKAKHRHVLPHLFPPSESLASGTFDPAAWPVSTHLETWEVSGVVLETPFGVNRCVVGIWAV